MRVNKKNLTIIFIGLFLLLLIVAIVHTPMQQVRQETKQVEKIVKHEDNLSMQKQNEKPVDDNVEDDDIDMGGLGGGSSGSEGGVSEILSKPCPSILEIGYLIAHNYTTTVKDDEVYLSIKNNKPFEDDIGVYIDANSEGNIEIRGLGIAILKSDTLTQWWRTLNVETQREFNVKLVPSLCDEINDKLVVTFPPSEEDYLD